MKLKVITSKGTCKHRLWIEGAPILLLTILNSEGFSRGYEIDSLRVNEEALSPIEHTLYKKWDGKFAAQLEKVRGEDLSELYARYFISVFSPVFSCSYVVDYDSVVLLWNKMRNYNTSCGKTSFDLQLKALLNEFLTQIESCFEDFDHHFKADSGAKLRLFEDEAEESPRGIFYKRVYSLSLNAVSLSVELDPSTHFDISRTPNPNDLAFFSPHILDDNFQLLAEYFQDMAYEVNNDLWPCAMNVLIVETGIVDSLVKRSEDAKNYLSTRIEIPELCAATLDAVHRLNYA